MSDVVIAHHGVKGMKWGVRRYQNKDGSLTAAGRQKQLNRLNGRMMADTIEISNYNNAKKYYDVRAKKARAKGKTDKASKYEAASKKASSIAEARIRDRAKAGKEMISALLETEKAGMSWKVSAAEFSSAPYNKDTRAITKEIMKEYGKLPYSARVLTINSNASSGNRFKVRDSSKMSDKKKERWQNRRRLNDYRAQSVTYYVY